MVKEPFNRSSQVASVPGPAYHSRLSFDDFQFKRSDIRCDHWQSETVSQEKHSALEDVHVRQNQYVRSLEIELRLLVGDIFDALDYPVGSAALRNRLLNLTPI